MSNLTKFEILYAELGLGAVKPVYESVANVVSTLNQVCSDRGQCIDLTADCQISGSSTILPSAVTAPLTTAYIQYIDAVAKAIPVIEMYSKYWKLCWEEMNVTCPSMLSQALELIGSRTQEFAKYYPYYQTDNYIDKVQSDSGFCEVHNAIVKDLQLDFNENEYTFSFNDMKYGFCSYVTIFFTLGYGLKQCSVGSKGDLLDLMNEFGSAPAMCPFIPGQSGGSS